MNEDVAFVQRTVDGLLLGPFWSVHRLQHSTELIVEALDRLLLKRLSHGDVARLRTTRAYVATVLCSSVVEKALVQRCIAPFSIKQLVRKGCGVVLSKLDAAVEASMLRSQHFPLCPKHVRLK